MKPTSSGEIMLESWREAHTAHHVLNLHRHNPFMSGEVLEGYVNQGNAHIIDQQTTTELMKGLWECFGQHKTSRVTRMLQRLPILGDHIYDYRQEAGRMLNSVTRKQDI
jgi:hypothetical protein